MSRLVRRGKIPVKSSEPLARRKVVAPGRMSAQRMATHAGQVRSLKVPEALPTEDKVRESALSKIKSAVFRKKTAIQEIVREPTSGGIVFRFTRDKKDIEILLIQDSKERWTIPKGHIEPGETAKMTARREIEEETGLRNVSVLT